MSNDDNGGQLPSVVSMAAVMSATMSPLFVPKVINTTFPASAWLPKDLCNDVNLLM